MGVLTLVYGIRHDAVSQKGNATAILAAEAAAEKAVFWMSKQSDMINALKDNIPGLSDTVSFPDSSASYQINMYTFIGSRPLYRIDAFGQSGIFKKRIELLVIQAVGGWDMARCRVPSGTSSTTSVYFTTGETIDMPIHINKYNDSPDLRDIYISGSPTFLTRVTMSESQHTQDGTDKYSSVMGLFNGGIDFDQPASKIQDESIVQEKIDRFKESTKNDYRLTPTATAPVSNATAAVQLEFWVNGTEGMVTITKNFMVRGKNINFNSWDLKASSPVISGLGENSFPLLRAGKTYLPNKHTPYIIGRKNVCCLF